MRRCDFTMASFIKFLVIMSMMWCDYSLELNDEEAPPARSHTAASMVYEKLSAVPFCSALPRGEERRSCIMEEDDAFLHLWGVDGGGDLNGTFSVHNGAIAAAAAEEGKTVRVAINLDLQIPRCPQCPKFMVAPMDVLPETTVAEAMSTLLPSLGQDMQSNLNIEATKEAYTTMVREAQVQQYKIVVVELINHLNASGINTVAIEGSTSAFLEKIRLMQTTAHRAWAAEDGKPSKSQKTVCEVGFNAGHSALLWLLTGATRVISFELGHHKYSHVAAQWISARFPGKLHLVMGDSSQTVPTFHTMFPHEKCDIVLVDGGHYFEPAWNDLVHFKELVDLGSGSGSGANNDGHVLLVDDTEMSEVGAAWAQAQAEGLVVEDGRVVSEFAEINDSPFTANLSWNGKLFVESPEAIVHSWTSSMAFGRYLPSVR